jgi:hypothetical protein
MSNNTDSVGMPWEKVIDKEVKSSKKQEWSSNGENRRVK